MVTAQTKPQIVASFDGNERIESNKPLASVNSYITIEFWAKGRNNPNDYSAVLEAYNVTNTRILNINLPNAGYIYWDAGNETGYDRIYKLVQTFEYQNVWTHWAFVKDSTVGMLSIYRNGQLWHQEGSKLKTIAGAAINKLTLGSYANLGLFWKGNLTEFRIWNIARTQADIEKDYKRRLTGTEPGLVTYWALNEGRGNIAYDQTSNGNNGTLFGAGWQQDTLDITDATSITPIDISDLPTVSSFDGNERIELLGKNLPSIGNAITIEFWAKGSNTPSESTYIFDARDAANTVIFYANLPWGNSYVYWYAGNPSGVDSTYKIIRADEYQNVWTHWAFVKDATTGQFLIYRNGGLWHQATNCFKTIGGNNIAKLSIGSAFDSTSFWKGSLTEFRIWNIARSQADIIKDIGRRLKGDEQGLTVYWPLNEGKGSIATDKTVNGLNATIYNASWDADDLNLLDPSKPAPTPPVSSAPVTPGIVATFDGNERIESNKPLGSVKSYITIEFWAKGGNNPGDSTTLLEAYNVTNTRIFNIHLPSGGYIYWDAGNETGVDRIYKAVQAYEYQNIWSHWAFVKDSTAGTLSIYRNGQIWHQESSKSKTIAGAAINKLTIGCRPVLDYPWKGSISEFRIWDIARTQADIEKDYKRRLSGTEARLITYWPLNEGRGNTAYDRTGNGNNGTLFGVGWQQDTLDLPDAAGATPINIPDLPTVSSFDGNERIELLGKNIPSLGNAVTVEFWTKGSNNPGDITYFFGAYDVNNVYILNIHLPYGSNIYWDAGNPSGYDRINKVVRADEYQNVWTHWAFVKDVATGLQVIYRNGGVWHLGTNCFKTIGGANIAKISLASYYNGTYNWKGSITEFRIWNVARSQAEIIKDIGRRLKGDEQGLALYWPLNEGKESIATDKTVNGFNGTIYNASWDIDDLKLAGGSPSTSTTKSIAIKNPASNKVLDVAGGKASAGGSIIGYDSNNSTGQKWVISPDGVIKSQLGDYAIDINGYQAVINSISGAATQKWEIMANGVIKNKSNNFALVLSDQGSYKVLLAYPIDVSNPQPDQKWELINM